MTDKKINELGLAEFIAGLISETFEAISASMEDQLRRKSELSAACRISVPEYAQEFIDESQVDDVIIELFGDGQGKHTIIEGGIYQPQTSTTSEQPALKSMLGIELEFNSDYALTPIQQDAKPSEKQESQIALTQAGVDQIRQSILYRLASEQQDMLLNILNTGLPRIAVDKGKILARVSFNVVETESVEAKAEETTSPRAKSVFLTRQSTLTKLGSSRSNL